MPVKVQGPDGKTYQFPDGTDKATAVAYFKKQSAPQAPPQPPGFTSRFGEAAGIPTTKEQWQAAQPSKHDQIGSALLGPTYDAANMAVGYGKNLVSEGRTAISTMRHPGSMTDTPVPAAISRFLTRGVLGPVGGTGVANLGDDLQSKNYSGAAGDAAGTLLNLLMMRKAAGPSPNKSVNYLTRAAGADMRVPIKNTLPEMKASAAQIGKPDSLEGMHGVTKNALKTIEAESDAALAQIGHKPIIPSQIAAKLRDLITPDMGSISQVRGKGTQFHAMSPEDLAKMRYIDSQAKLFEKPWTYDQLDKKRIRLNAELNAFEKKGEGGRYTAKMGNINTAIDKAVADTIRDVVYPQMDAAAGRPPGYFRALKHKQGSLIELSDELNPANRKSRTEKLAGETAYEQGSSRFDRENIGLGLGPSGVPRPHMYGLTKVIKKPNPLAKANKRVGMGFSTGSDSAKGYVGTLPMRQQLFPEQEEKR